MKQIPNFPGYLVTKGGRVWSTPGKSNNHKGKWLHPRSRISGHLSVQLRRDNESHHQFVHRVVLMTYVGPCPEGMECRHLNGDPADNRLKNLKWGTRSENMYDAVQHGTHPAMQNAKLNKEQVKWIISAYNTGKCLQRELAEHFGVSRICVNDILNKRTWRHIWNV